MRDVCCMCCTVLPHLMTFEAADQALVSTPPDQPAAVVAEGRSEVSLSLETKQNLILLSGVLLSADMPLLLLTRV